MKNKNIKLLFETRDSKHLVGTNGDYPWPLIELIPRGKQKYQATFVAKIENISFNLHTTNSWTV